MAEQRTQPYIPRQHYLNELISFKDDRIIKVITGIRRSGKSTLLFDIYADWLLANGVGEDQIIKVDLEPMESKPLHDPDALYKHITDKLVAGKQNYVFIDEVISVQSFYFPRPLTIGNH